MKLEEVLERLRGWWLDHNDTDTKAMAATRETAPTTKKRQTTRWQERLTDALAEYVKRKNVVPWSSSSSSSSSSIDDPAADEAAGGDLSVVVRYALADIQLVHSHVKEAAEAADAMAAMVGGRDLLAMHTCLAVVVALGILPCLPPPLHTALAKRLEEELVLELGFFQTWNVDIYDDHHHQHTTGRRRRRRQRDLGETLKILTGMVVEKCDSLIPSLICRHFLTELLCAWMWLRNGPPDMLHYEAPLCFDAAAEENMRPDHIDRFDGGDSRPPEEASLGQYDELLRILLHSKRVSLVECLFSLMKLAVDLDEEMPDRSNAEELNVSRRRWLRAMCVEGVNSLLLSTEDGVLLILDMILSEAPKEATDVMERTTDLLLTPPYYMSSAQTYFQRLLPHVVEHLRLLGTHADPKKASIEKDSADTSYRMRALTALVHRLHERGFPTEIVKHFWDLLLMSRLRVDIEAFLMVAEALFRGHSKSTPAFVNSATLYLAPTLFLLLSDRQQEDGNASIVIILTDCVRYADLEHLKQLPLKAVMLQLETCHVTMENIDDDTLAKIASFAKLIVNFVHRSNRAECSPALFRLLIDEFKESFSRYTSDAESYRKYLATTHLIMALCDESDTSSLFSSQSEMLQLLSSLIGTNESTMVTLAGEILMSYCSDSAIDSSSFAPADVELILDAVAPLTQHREKSTAALMKSVRQTFERIREDLRKMTGTEGTLAFKTRDEPDDESEIGSPKQKKKKKEKDKGEKQKKQKEKEPELLTMSFDEFKSLLSGTNEAFGRAEMARRLCEEVELQHDGESEFLPDAFLRLLECCKDEDSFVYLRAVEGLRQLCIRFPSPTVPWMLFVFSNAAYPAAVPAALTAAAPFTEECSLRIAEALLGYIRRSGEALGKPDNKLGNVLLSLVERGLDGGGSARMASCLGLLAAVLETYPYALGRDLDTMLLAVIDIARGRHQNHEVRRGGVLVLCSLIEALGDSIVQVIPAHVRSVRDALKWVQTADLDDVCKVHAANATTLLDDAIQALLFPT